jgi:hypothetical protein
LEDDVWAVDALSPRHSRKGFACGEASLNEYIERYAALVEAINGRAARFYRAYEFIPLTDAPGTLFLPLDTIRQLP